MLREILQVLRSEYAFALFTASFAVLAAVIAFAIVGYLGLAILGILTLLICATMEIGKDGPLGSINTPDLHAWDAQHREAMTPAERAEHRSEVSVLLRLALLGAIDRSGVRDRGLRRLLPFPAPMSRPEPPPG
jgi:hypothetical protein